MHELKLPKWGQVMEEAIVLEWLKKPGEQVTTGEALVVVETDKADGEIEAPVDGVLEEICAEPEETVPVEGVLCRIREAGS
jgi:pyruvate/2-oxoglutarate dehydrogenase complex dihydrolipoamide acyltransferase (E2) component